MRELEEVVYVRNLKVWYEDKQVLNNVNFSIKEGEMVLLIGPTGCGKSTLCLTLTGIIPHRLARSKAEGEVIVDNINVLKEDLSEISKHITMVFQNPDEQLTSLYVEDEVAFGAENLKLPSEEVKKRVDEALKFVGLDQFREKIVYDLSGGQKQRLAIAAALAMRPKVLILDSPISNLDPIGASEILSVINKLRKKYRLTTLIVEHKVDELMPMVDKLIVMNARGEIILTGEPKDVIGKHGKYLREKLGLWIPQISELFLKVKEDVERYVPLTIDEALKLPLSRLKIKPVLETKVKHYKEKPLIVIDNVTFIYPDGTVALRNVSTSIYPGEFVAIVGQNGSGKTTLAYNIIGVLKPTYGRIIVDGMDTKETPIDKIARRIGYVFQYPEHQFITEKVYDEVAFELRKLGLKGEELDRRVKEVLKRLNMLDVAESHPYNLSLGQKRLLSAALMTLTNPKAIILDEPTYGQDARHVYQLMNFAEELHERGCAIIMITHDMRLVAEYAERVVAMSFGKIVYDGDPRKFFEEEELLRKIALAPPPITQWSIRAHKAPILTLEEFFKALT